jgi:hypothetical protein
MRPAAAASLVLLCALSPGPSYPQLQVDPWRLLEQVREELSSGPLTADFIHSFRPPGFSGGERESGRLSLGLPDCVRWDYELPYPRTYLLCEDRVHAWTGGESSGRTYSLAPEDKWVLVLLSLDPDDLRQRFEAHPASAVEGSDTLSVRLSSHQQGGRVTEATLEIDPQRRQLVRLSYLDVEGNETSFRISGYRTLADQDRFVPPAELIWLEE